MSAAPQIQIRASNPPQQNPLLGIRLMMFRADSGYMRERSFTVADEDRAQQIAERIVRRFGHTVVVEGSTTLRRGHPYRQACLPCEHCAGPIWDRWEEVRLCQVCSEGLEQCARCRGPLDSDEGGNLYCLECDTCEDCLEPIIEGVSYHDAGCPVVVEE